MAIFSISVLTWLDERTFSGLKNNRESEKIVFEKTLKEPSDGEQRVVSKE